MVLILQDLRVSPNWDPTAAKVMTVSPALQVSPALLDNQARLDRRVCVTTVEAVREFLSSQVSFSQFGSEIASVPYGLPGTNFI